MYGGQSMRIDNSNILDITLVKDFITDIFVRVR